MRRVVVTVIGTVVLGGAATASNDIDALIEDLRDDDVRSNAIEAQRALRGRLDEAPVRAALERALDSEDYQQRQLAASLLRFELLPSGCVYTYGPATWGREPDAEMPGRLIEVTIEGLGDDGIPIEDGSGLYVGRPNAMEGLWALTLHAEAAKEALIDGLDDEDVQRRFLCALALGFGGVDDAADEVTPALLAFVGDDQPALASWYASHALWRLGDAARPTVVRALNDAQGVRAERLRLILRRIANPTPTRGRAPGAARDAIEPTTLPRYTRDLSWLGGLQW
jgi:HEAT repeat protein